MSQRRWGKNGPAALAIRYAERVTELIASGVPVFVDAIFLQAEFDVLKSRVPLADAHLLAIDASFDLRYQPVASGRAGEHELRDDDFSTAYYEGETIDLT